jgi:hypothetical protein
LNTDQSWQELTDLLRSGDEAATRTFAELVIPGLLCILRHRGLLAVREQAEKLFAEALAALQRGEIHGHKQFTAFLSQRVRETSLAAKRESVEQARTARWNSKVVASLSSTEREILIRCYAHGQNESQVCAEMGIQPARLMRGMMLAPARKIIDVTSQQWMQRR